MVKLRQGSRTEGECWVIQRGYKNYKRQDGSYHIYCSKRIILDKTQAHNWFRYMKTHYTNVLGTMGPVHFL